MKKEPEDKKRKAPLKKTREDKAAPALQLPSATKANKLFVVGIGASAGGLEAFQSLLPNLPMGENFAYVIVQHLDPNHPTMLTSLLQRYTAMDVNEVSDGQYPKGGTISVTPPGRNVVMENGRLLLSETVSAVGPKPSVDLFFTSLAEDKSDKAIGIILSGTGSDGAHGIRAIKAEGGIAIVQEPDTARYAGMPEVAIATGHVDLILAPGKMGEELVSILKYPELLKVVSPEDKSPDDVDKILKMVHEQLGCDFSDYKRNTINRRIGRRMAVHKFTLLEDYIRYLEKTPDELELLVKDILISVTSFFRDAEAFNALAGVLPKLIQKKEEGDPIRIWIPGCSTGEEAYSIAIILAQALGKRIKRFVIQIFGTDLDQAAIERARKGIYPEATVVDVERKLLDRYFVRKDNMIQIVEPIREMIVFAKHNLINDPPFAHLDLISCRNMLIYFNQNLQNRVVSTFHYVLNPGGYLFLGKSESISQFSDLFAPISKRWRVYESRSSLKNSAAVLKSRAPVLGVGYRAPALKSPLSAKETTHEAILKIFSPASVLIDDRMQGLYFRGDTSPYLRPPEGEGNLDVLQMAKNEIRLDLRTLAHRCSRDNTPGISRPVKMNINGIEKNVVIHVNPIDSGDAHKGLMLVSFETLEEYQYKGRETPSPKGEDPRVYEIEEELNETRERLQTTIEELETTNEELMSLNEELQSSNEELQSSNEELETTSEELQSTNEELNTVNEELQVKTAELSTVNNDLENILTQIDLPLVIVDGDLKVLRFNQTATSIFSFSAGDAGQVITSIGTHLALPNLREKINQVISGRKTIDEIVENSDRHYYMRIHPLMDREDRPLGAMLIFVDKTALLQKQNELEAIGLISRLCLNSEHVGVVYEQLPGLLSKYFGFPYVVIDLVQEEGIETVGAVGLEYDPNRPVRVSMEGSLSGEVISTQNPVVMTDGAPLAHTHPLLEGRNVKTLICAPLRLHRRSIGTLLLADHKPRRDVDDLTQTLSIIGHHIAIEAERKRVKCELEQQNETLHKVMDHIPVLLCFYDRLGHINFVNQEFIRILGWSFEALKQIEDPLSRFYPEDGIRREAFEYMMEAPVGWRDFVITTRNGAKLDTSWSNVRLSDGSHIGIGIDLRERKKKEQELIRKNEELQDFAYMASHDLQEPLRKVNTFAAILEEEYARVLDEQGRDFIGRMVEATQRMQTLLSSLVQYSRIGWESEKLVPVDLNVVVQDAISALSVEIEETEGKIQADALPTITGDLIQLTQLFQNLIHNALKFSRKEYPPEVKITGAVEPMTLSAGNEAPTKGVRIEVTDNGIGFKENFAETVFKPFKRLHGRSDYPGAGMGLAICRRIVERHGGDISVHSEPGEGTTFEIVFPLKQPVQRQ